MSTLRLEAEPRITRVEVTDECLIVDLADGRVISVPLEWYPRLVHGTERERARYELSGHGYGIHWPDLDEDISVENLLAGRRSGESERSFRRWLERRQVPRPGNPTT
ncbi:MAG: DUF2442 domain-containing protein [Gemmatimonadetes bacterium]|nr:DUF2442 domain-containing protein [Gemmatimonadota bacterium]